MRLRLDDALLGGVAVRRLGAPGGPGALLPTTDMLFDPALPLPLPQMLPAGLLNFRGLFDTLPFTYGTHVYHGHAQLLGFSAAMWPAMCGVVDAIPFFEWSMHADLFSPWYRDHQVHQLRVAAIGDLLLDQRVGTDSLLDKIVAILMPRLHSAGFAPITVAPREFVRLAWWLTALFHDCLYAYEQHQKDLRRLQGLCHLPLANTTQLAWLDAHRALADLLGSLTETDLANCKEGKHQFAGAAELALQNSAYENVIGGRESLEFRLRRRTLFSLAAEAILSHHGSRHARRRIIFDKDPLAFLLTLSDELHEAGRFSSTTRADPSDPALTVLRFEVGDIERISVDTTGVGGANLRVTYHCRSGTTRIRGKSPVRWGDDKKRTIKTALRFGPHELFRNLDVRVR